MYSLKKYALFFAVGSVGYGVIEMLWRGYTHWSMLLAGGVCFTAFSKIASCIRPLWQKALIAAGVITSVEFVFGMVFNRLLKQNIWDYSKMRGNVLGQICPLYSALWLLLSVGFVPVAGRMNGI